MVLLGVRRLALVVSALCLFVAPAGVSAQAASGGIRVIESGDTLWDIAQDAGVDVATLLKLNGLQEGDVILVGQSLKLPSGVSGTSVSGAGASGSGGGSRGGSGGARAYTVAEGDTLSGIAQQLGTTTAALIDANHLEDGDRLSIGTQLLAPSTSGASASASASATGAAAAPAPAATPSATATPAATAAPSATATPAAASTRAAPSGGRRSIVVSYTVQSGETLSQIARQFDVGADAIAQASGVNDPNRIGVGTVLKVPLPGHEHVVKPGETLRDIAALERVDLGSLIDFNGLDDPELIRVDQVIVVPAP
ncbi:MAG TPA: LysM peptidoglycan-binding domain-containing protein, partial [Chloroflexota bacterium]|nr:LysM peptidoglycan-binding domain-containing protein [Chloroflexota bacterium]